MVQLDLGTVVLCNVLDMGGALWGVVARILPDSFAFDDRDEPKRQKKRGATEPPDAHMNLYEVTFETGLIKKYTFESIKQNVPPIVVDHESRHLYFYAGNLRRPTKVDRSFDVLVDIGEVKDINLGRACDVTFDDSDNTERVFVRNIHPSWRSPTDSTGWRSGLDKFPLSVKSSSSTGSAHSDRGRTYTSIISERAETPHQPVLPAFTTSVSHITAGSDVLEKLLRVEVKHIYSLIV